jgi:transcription termination factor Rho
MKKQIVEGILEVMPEGYGFLRDPKKNFNIIPNDAYVSPQLIRQHNLREGLLITGELGKPSRPGQSTPLSKVLTCNGLPVEQYALLPEIKSLTSIDPEEQLIMTREDGDLTGRMIDLLTPLGKGQRGMIISPPKAGKTTILKHIAKAALENHPEVKVMVLLVDERPEEVTDFRRDLKGAEVFHSSADQDVENHLRITSLTMNMATRRVECGENMIMMIDSLTRMGRAFNKDADSGGKTLSGGLAANALELPRRFFGAARNIENGGSLTIMATILVDTGSRMDEIIFQEFKGTGNLDLVLSRECAERRLFPAINIRESGTRKEHKILSPEALKESHNLRRKVAEMKAPEALEVVLRGLN